MQFKNRIEAGKQLAKIINIQNQKNTVVLALPRGGIPLGITISSKFSIPLDVVLAKKVGHPMQPEFAIGAVTEDGDIMLNDEVSVNQNWIKQEVTHIQEETERRRALYDEIIDQQILKGKDVIIVDDGIATGMTMFAAIKAVRKKKANRILIAVPIIPENIFNELQDLVDEIITIEVPIQFLGAVGAYYEDFPQITDKEVQKMLKNHRL